MKYIVGFETGITDDWRNRELSPMSPMTEMSYLRWQKWGLLINESIAHRRKNYPLGMSNTLENIMERLVNSTERKKVYYVMSHD